MQRIAPFCYYYQELSGLHALELAVVELGVEAVCSKQLVVAALLHNVAVLHHGNEERAADAAGKAALRQQVAREIWAQRCAQAEQRARKELVWQLGDAVKGPLPKQLVGGNYFAEQRQFNLSLQANGINFDQFLKVRGQTVEEFRAWLHAQAERKLRSWLGLLLVAEKEGLAPTDAEVEAAAAHWDAKLDGERTFPANDARKVRQRLARERAEQFIVEHSTLTPPPDEPIVQKVESK